jgi:hypothetical protein
LSPTLGHIRLLDLSEVNIFAVFWARPIQSLFRKQPILATALTAGAVDGLIGSVDDRVALALFGFAVATGALSLRWWQLQRMPAKLPEQAAIVYLEAEQNTALSMGAMIQVRQLDRYPAGWSPGKIIPKGASEPGQLVEMTDRP